MGHMMTNNMPKFGHISPRRVNRIPSAQDFMKLNANFLFALYPTNTRKQVANDLNASPDTVRRWLDQTQAPSATWITQLLIVYGPTYADQVLYPLSYRTLEDKNNELERKRAQLEAEQAKLDRELAECRHARDRNRTSVVARSG